MNVVAKRVIVLPKQPPFADETPSAAPVAARPLEVSDPTPTLPGDAGVNAERPAPSATAATPTPTLTPTPAPAPASTAGAAGAARSAVLPLALAAVALLAFLLDQTEQRWRERQQLQQSHAEQQPQVERAQQLRGQLDRLAADTQRLADAGNANAAALVGELRRRGITINAAGTPR